MNRRSQGFTLMELLVVLAVMGVMMGLIGFTLLGGGGNELGAAQRELLGMVQKARAQSALSGRETRLLVWNDPEDEDKYHRYLEIVTKDANQSESWVVAGEGFFLTDGVYLVPSDESLSVQSDDWREDAFSIWSHDDGEEFKLNPAFKGMRKEGGSEDFIYMAFNGSGNLICREDSSGVLQPPKLVLAVGEPNPADENKALRFNDANSIAGILMRRFGGFAVLDVNDFIRP
jgi:prepilin-type N-terminal cleavage/methylation domain-containing protein